MGFTQSISENRKNIIQETGCHVKRTAGFFHMIRLKLSGWTHIITTDEVVWKRRKEKDNK